MEGIERRSRVRWRPPAVLAGPFGNPAAQVALSVFAVLLLLLSSSDLSNLRLPSSHFTAASSGAPSSANATGYLPYLLDPSTFPLPSPLLNGSGGATLPQLTTASVSAVSVFELAYVQTSYEGMNNLSFVSGSYNTTLAVQAYTGSGCGGPCPRMPILWGTPVVVAKFGRVNVSGDAIASSGALVAVAAAFGTKTIVWLSDGYGAVGTWTNLTAPQGLLSGVLPRLALIPCGLIVTTIGSSALYVSTFPLPCHYAPNSPNVGAGGQNGPSPPVPTVTAVNPNYGSIHTVINLTGTNYAGGATAYFGGTSALATIVLSSTKIHATVPTGTGVVHVTVTSGGYTSNATCTDLFTYGNFAGAPTINAVSPSQGPAGTLVTLTGSGFTFGGLSAVTFGGVVSPQIVSVTSSQIKAVAPSGNGTVYVTATVGGKTSLQNCAAEFTYNPGTAAPNSGTLPPAITAYPAWITGGPLPVVGIFASNSSNSEIRFYNSTDYGKTFKASDVEPFNDSLGSQVFSAIGGTRVVVGSGVSGQVAFAAEGPQLFGLFTSRVQGRSAVETVSSTDSGHTWTGPYLTSSPVGAVSDPEAATSPAGYAYATWRENGAGPWQLDEAVFSFDGKALQLPVTVPSSGGSSGSSAGPPSIAVDGFQRPLYVWSAWNDSTRMSELRYTGGFLTPKVATQTLRNAWNATVPADFQPIGTSALGYFKANVNGSIVNLQTAIASPNSKRLCWSWTNLSRYVYPNVTAGDPAPFIASAGASVTGCSSTPAPGTDLSKVAALVGPFAANVYLYVLADWISEALGYGSLPAASWAGSPIAGSVNVVVTPPSGGGGTPFVLGLGSSASDSQGDTASVGSTTINPNTLWLNSSDLFVGRLISGTITLPLSGGGWESCGGWNTTDQVHSVSASVTVMNSSGHKFSGTFTNPFRIPSVWVTNLSARENGSWWENVSLTFQEWHASDNTCSGQKTSGAVTPITAGWPSNSVLRLKGTFTTGLSFDPWTTSLPLTVQSLPDPKNTSLADNSVHWNNTIWANATAWNNESYCGSGCTPYTNLSRNLTTWQTPENLGFKPQPNNNQYYQVYAIIQSHSGGYTNGWPTTLNSAEVATASNPQVGRVSCSYYQTANPIHLGLPSPGVTQVTDTSATVTWYSDQNGSGWLAYNDTWEAQFSQTAVESSSGNTTFPYAYQVELRGLRPWGVYQATLGVGAYSGCLEFMNTTHTVFQTLTQAALLEFDSPYDSISQQGGGASVQWQEPAGFSAISNYTNGSLTYFPTTNTSAVAVIPLSSLWLVEDDGPFGTTMGVNLTGLTVNLQYNITLSLNYTVRPPSGHGSWLSLWVGSKPFVFWYEKDTSGDGLTDWEKLRGWEVTSQDPRGSWRSSWVAANPSLFATNGLTSDYQEKLYGLNPTTVDSAGSHMLDTWNLTFDLGPKSSKLTVPSSATFQYWSEQGNSSTNYKWTTVCQYYVAPGSSCAKGGINPGTTWSNISGADSWAWASRVLWSRAALSSFVNFSGVQNSSWLRATLGNASTEWTLTVWGKLSWGANPLAASTPRDGISDGARINPLYDEELVIGSLWSNLTTCAHPSSGAYGWAVLFYLNWSTPAGPHELPAQGNYSSEALDTSSSCGGIANYQVPIPINGTSQNQSLQVRILLNKSSSPTYTNLNAQKFSGSLKQVSITYDSVWGKSKSYSYSGTNGTLSFTLSVVPAGVKTNTLIWLPTDNSTLNNLPWGLKRYTGEQAFDLVVVDQSTSSPINSYYIPYAQNLSDQYRVTLSPGLNNILIPRGQFLYSVLGQAVLLGKNTSWTNASAKPPLLNANENSTIGTYGSSNPLRNLACYWQNRAVNNNASGITGAICSTETGTAIGNTKGLVVVAATSASGLNTGGVPGNPSLENSSEEGAALQSVLTLNVSTQTGLNLLLAALFDNSTGGLNGTFLPVTLQVPSLGLSSVVTQELANATQSSGGLFGVPWGTVPPPVPPPCNSVWCYASNLVSGIVTVGSQFFSYVWSGVTAVAQFIDDHLPTWLKQAGAALISRTAGALIAAGQAILAVLDEAIAAILHAASVFFSSIVQPIVNAITRFSAAIASGIQSFFGGVVNYSNSGTGLGTAFTTELNPFNTVLGVFQPVQGLVQGFEATLNILQPVLNLLDPLTLIATLAQIIGFGGVRSAIQQAEGFATWAGGQVLGGVTKLITGMADAIGIGQMTITPPSGTPDPSTGQFQTMLTGYQGTTGDSNYPNLVSPALSQSPPSDSIDSYFLAAVDFVLTVTAGAAVAKTFFSNLALTSETKELSYVTVQLAKVPYAELMFQMVGLALDIMSFAASGWIKVILAIIALPLIIVPHLEATFVKKLFPNSRPTPFIQLLETVSDVMGGASAVYDINCGVSGTC